MICFCQQLGFELCHVIFFYLQYANQYGEYLQVMLESLLDVITDNNSVAHHLSLAALLFKGLT